MAAPDGTQEAKRVARPVASASWERLRIIEAERRQLRQTFVRRFWLRWHMALMLTATFGAGVLANKMMLLIPVHEMAWRWVFALIVSYLAFFGCVRIWLAYVGARPIYGDRGLDNYVNFNGGSSPSNLDGFHGGGGDFGGGGANVDWGDSPLRVLDGGGGGGGGGLDVGDGDGCGLVIVGLLALAAIAAALFSVIYLLIGAPVMLADTAFSALLAGGLVRHVRRMDEWDWEGNVIRSTWKPFLGVVALAVVTGIVAHFVVPGARTLGEVWMLYRG
jgi:hypothetical protein